jgi:hypothetical protein
MRKIIYIFSYTIIALFCCNLNAQTWSGKIRLTWNGDFNNYPDIAVDSGDNIHLGWSRQIDTSLNREIYYKNSSDGGSSWSTPQRLTWNSNSSKYPNVVVDTNDYIHIVWEDVSFGKKEILYKKSTDVGTTWSALVRLTYNNNYSLIPCLAVDSEDHLRLAWAESTVSGSDDIYFKRSQDAGTTWSGPTRLTWSHTDCLNPDIAINSNKIIFIVWQDFNSGNDEIYFKKSNDGGLSWSILTRLTWNSGHSQQPDLAVDSSDKIHLIWEDSTSGHSNIYYKNSTNAGNTWSPLTQLTWTSQVFYYPAIAVDSNDKIYIVFSDAADLYMKIGTQ